MKRLRFIVNAKKRIVFTNTSINFVRGLQTSKQHQVPFTNGNGTQLANNTTLLEEGIVTQIGYLKISIDGNQTLNGTGILNLLITHYPSNSQSLQSKTVSIDTSSIDITFTYNSKPVNEDMEIEVNNRQIRVISMSDFVGHWSDYDGDTLSYITIYNTDNNLLYNNVVYIQGTPISISDINAGLLKYVADDVDTQYNDDYQYTVTDTQGNISE